MITVNPSYVLQYIDLFFRQGQSLLQILFLSCGVRRHRVAINYPLKYDGWW